MLGVSCWVARKNSGFSASNNLGKLKKTVGSQRRRFNYFLLRNLATNNTQQTTHASIENFGRLAGNISSIPANWMLNTTYILN
jgi:hypothetical protein